MIFADAEDGMMLGILYVFAGFVFAAFPGTFWGWGWDKIFDHPPVNFTRIFGASLAVFGALTFIRNS